MQQNQPVVLRGVAPTAPILPQQQTFQQPPPRVVVHHVRQHSNGPPVQVRVGALPPQPPFHQPVVHQQQPVQPVPQATLEPQGVVNAVPQPLLTFVRPPSPSPSNTATQGDDDYDEQDFGQPLSPVQMPPPATTTTAPLQVPFGVQCASPPPPQLHYPEPSQSLCPPPGYFLMQQQPLSRGPIALPVQQQPRALSPQAPLLPFVPTTAPSPTAGGSSGEWRQDQDGKYTFRPSSGSETSGSSAVSTRLLRPDELPPPLQRRMQLQQEAQRQISLPPDEHSGGSSQGSLNNTSQKKRLRALENEAI